MKKADRKVAVVETHKRDEQFISDQRLYYVVSYGPCKAHTGASPEATRCEFVVRALGRRFCAEPGTRCCPLREPEEGVTYYCKRCYPTPSASSFPFPKGSKWEDGYICPQCAAK